MLLQPLFRNPFSLENFHFEKFWKIFTSEILHMVINSHFEYFILLVILKKFYSGHFLKYGFGKIILEILGKSRNHQNIILEILGKSHSGH